jgi:4-amino-4-deoxy-L-arabinose transferase-like glycosyltransferase
MMDKEKIKEGLKNWLKDPLNLVFIAVLIFAIILRVYIFSLTSQQPLWWDEAAYGSLAKNFVSHAWDNTSIIVGEKSIRPPLFPLIWGIFNYIGFGEYAARIFLLLIPSIFSVLLVYLIGKEMYSKIAGITSAFVFSVLWIHLFYTGRLLTHVPALSLLFLGVYFFVKTFKTEFNAKYFAYSLISASLAALIRYPKGLIFFAFLAFLIITNKFYLLKRKDFWISGIAGILPLLIFFAYNLFAQGNAFPVLGGEGSAAVSETFAFGLLSFIPTYLKTVFFVIFICGLLLAGIELFLGYDLIAKDRKIQSHLLIILMLVVIYGYFIFIMRGAEDRWLFSMTLPLSCLAGFACHSAYELGKSYNKNVIIAIISILLIFGAYSQISFANELTKNKATSYQQMKEGFEWISNNAPEDAIVLERGAEVYSLYYGNRMYEPMSDDITDFVNTEAKVMVTHVFATQPNYLNSYLQSNQGTWVPVMISFLDSERKQPGFIVYYRVK